ncbi:MAG: phosphate acyltransferase PlsX [Eubacterium sp.]|nr:phosphate acyltransferase PlsX [Eubacterium sp.]
MDVTVALDAMGGDYAPAETVKGAVEAVKEFGNIRVILVGRKDMIDPELGKYEDYPKDRISVVNATEIIDMGEVPTLAIKEKKDSSLVVAMRLVKSGEADAIVSAGSTGAILVGGQLVVGRIKGVKRPALAPFLPTKAGMSLLIDCGANVDAKPENLVQFAQMGSIYYENVMGVKSPTVGIVNIGTEEEKGNRLVKETTPLLKECKDINFIGSIEARDIPSKPSNVLVCEAFVGNVILKLFEGLAKTFLGVIKKALYKSVKTKIGGALIKGSLKEQLSIFDTKSQGGAPLLGLKGLVVKAHGNSKSFEIKTAIGQCITFKENDISGKIAKAVSDDE